MIIWCIVQEVALAKLQQLFAPTTLAVKEGETLLIER